MFHVTSAIICSFAILGPITAQDSAVAPVKQSQITVVQQSPLLDGFLDDEVWQQAAKIDDFTEVKPKQGRPAAQRTVCYLARDHEFLYIAFECFEDNVGEMVLQNVSRDAFLSDDDRIEFVLDTFNNKQSAYFFQMSAAGSRGDALISENG
ncbi:MAG TPA: hypothetical protein EYN86_04825, partial [Planctomycetes bacterium]|nr:hypothetical protein [Planctomycetota bacterium]